MEAKNLRIVFMGTPEFAATSLRRLVAEGYNIVAVVTTPDKPAGRGLKIQKSDVKVVADFGNVYESVNDIDEFIEEFADKIVHVHFKDLVYTKENETGKAYKTLRGLYMNEVKIGTGIIDFKKCIDLLKKNNYNGYYTIEYGVSDDESKDMDEVLEYLNNLL